MDVGVEAGEFFDELLVFNGDFGRVFNGDFGMLEGELLVFNGDCGVDGVLNSLVEATAFLDLDGGSLVEVGVEAGEFFDGSLVKGAVEETSFWDLDGDGSVVEVGSGRKLVEGGGFFYDNLVEATAFLDLDGGSLVEVGVEAGEFLGEGGLGVIALNTHCFFPKVAPF